MDTRLCCCIDNEHCRCHIALTYKLAALVLCYALTLSKAVRVIQMLQCVNVDLTSLSFSRSYG